VAGGGPYESLVKAYAAAARSDDAEVEHWAGEFLAARSMPDELLRYQDPVTVMLGRAQLNQRKLGASIASFKRVKNTSNSFASAVNGLSWAFVEKGEMANAVGEAQNTVVGGLRSVFDPETNLVVSIALNESCNFPEAMDSVRHFKRSYAKAYRWLMTYGKAPTSGAPPARSLYEQLVQGLKTRRNVPDRVLTEWLRSPLFLASQDELNLLLDEKTAQLELPGKLARVIAEKKNKKWHQAEAELLALLQSSGATIAPREERLIASINHDLDVRTRQMKVSLYEVLSNLRLLEAEIYNSMSEKMIADYANPEEARKAKERAAMAKKEHIHGRGLGLGTLSRRRGRRKGRDLGRRARLPQGGSDFEVSRIELKCISICSRHGPCRTLLPTHDRDRESLVSPRRQRPYGSIHSRRSRSPAERGDRRHAVFRLAAGYDGLEEGIRPGTPSIGADRPSGTSGAGPHFSGNGTDSSFHP
jgi:hypothetical protein